MYNILSIAIWIGCGIISLGGWLAYCEEKEFPKEFPIESLDYSLWSVIVLTGPIGLFPTLIVSGGFKYGLLFRVSRNRKIKRVEERLDRF